MALKDSSGRITIDEYAAQQDIQKINQAKAALENSKKAIENLINQASNEQGQTAVAIVEKATELRNQINTMIGRLNETSSFISRTIAHYQEVDRLVKEAIQNSMRAQAAAAGQRVCILSGCGTGDKRMPLYGTPAGGGRRQAPAGRL